jgi:hypothetical protein
MSLFDLMMRPRTPHYFDSKLFLSAVGESSLSNVAVDEPGKSVYRFAIQQGFGNKDDSPWKSIDSPLREGIAEVFYPLSSEFVPTPSLWIEITEVANALTVLVRTSSSGETAQEIVKIDSADRLFYEQFRSLQETIDKFFWSMVSAKVDMNARSCAITYGDPQMYIIEAAHNGKHHWCLTGDGFDGPLCHLFLALPHVRSMTAAQDRQVRAQVALEAKAAQAIHADQAFQSKLKELSLEGLKDEALILKQVQLIEASNAQEAQAIEAELQTLKSKLIAGGGLWKKASQAIEADQAFRHKWKEAIVSLSLLGIADEIMIEIKFIDRFQSLISKQVHLIEALEFQDDQKAQAIEAEIQALKAELIAVIDPVQYGFRLENLTSQKLNAFNQYVKHLNREATDSID